MKLQLTGCAGNPICLDTQDPSDLFSQVALEDHCVGDATHVILLSQYTHDKRQPNIQKSVTLLYESLAKTATAYPDLQDYFVSDF